MVYGVFDIVLECGFCLFKSCVSFLVGVRKFFILLGGREGSRGYMF